MRTDRYEHELTQYVQRYFRNKGFRFQKTELQFFEYNIDIYCHNRPTGATLAVELKVRDWKRAIQQAHIYQLCADYVYIAMPEETIRRIDLEELEEEGIGLICVYRDGRCKLCVPPKQSTVQDKRYKEKIIVNNFKVKKND